MDDLTQLTDQQLSLLLRKLASLRSRQVDVLRENDQMTNDVYRVIDRRKAEQGGATNRIRPEQVIPLAQQLKDVHFAILAQIRGLAALQQHRDEIEAELARRKAEQEDK